MTIRRTHTVTRRGRATESTRAAAVMAARVGSALVAVLSVVLLPVEAWGAPSGSNATTWSSTGTVSGVSPTTTVTTRLTLNSSERLSALSIEANRDSGSSVVVQVRCGDDWSTISSGVLNGPMWNLSDGSPVAHGNPTNICASPSQPVTGVRTWYGGSLLTTATQLMSEWTTSLNRPASTCSASYLDARAGYVGTTLSVVVKWAGTAPLGGWTVKAPGTAYDGSWTPTGSLTVPPTAGTTPGEYGATGTVSGLTAGTSVRIEKASDPSCYVLAVMGTTTASTAPSSNGTDSSGADCGINVFCAFSAALKSAFTPQASTLAAWDDLKSEAADVVPFGYVTDALVGLTYMTGCSGIECDDDKLTRLCFDPGIGGADLAGPLGSGVCPFGDNAITAFLTSQRAFLSFLAWAAVLAPLVGLVWRRTLPFMGGSD